MEGETWLKDLDDEELVELHDLVLRELYVRAHNRSHDEEKAA